MDAWHLDLYRWATGLERPAGRPLVLGINGPQGSGKSTLAAALVDQAGRDAQRWVALSVDDVYLTRAEQAALAAEHAGDGLFEVRGAPGTHDVALGVATLDALSARSGTVRIPAYDKAAHAGKGDRRPIAEWPTCELPLDVVVFEGWMLGFPVLGDRLADARLAKTDRALEAYAPWTARLDAMIQLRVEDPLTVVQWRVEAEANMRARRGAGMTDEEASAYIERFLPFYAVYPQALEDSPPVPSQYRCVVIGPERQPVDRIPLRS